MKVIIFIGHFKTGSSSIQSFLSSNFYRLLQAGILYPSVESRGVSRNMKAILDGEDAPTTGAGLNVIEPHNALALRLKNEEDGHGVPPYYPHLPSGFQMMEIIDNQIAALQPDTVILCSEVFALLGLTEGRRSVRRLARRLSGHEVTIYCNLRRPDDYLSSWHRQRLKFGAKLGRLSGPAFDEYLGSAHFEQDKLVEGWLKGGFPEARLVLRNFDDVKAAGGSIVDFVNRSGADFPPDLFIPKDQNPSVPSAFAEIGRLAIHELPSADSKKVINWLTTARRRVDCPADDQIEDFGAKNRDIMSKRFLPIADSLTRMNGGKHFYKDASSFGLLRPVDPVLAARTALPGLIADAQERVLAPTIIDWLKGLDQRLV